MSLEVAFNHFIHRRLRRIDHLLHGLNLLNPSHEMIPAPTPAS
jgi:hypothetical protein